MSVRTRASVMFVLERTIDCLVLVHVEIIVLLLLIEQLGADLAFVMSERAKVAILAFLNTQWEIFAELPLVFFRVIELLDFILRERAILIAWAIVFIDAAADFKAIIVF